MWPSGQGQVGGDAACISGARKCMQTFAGRGPCYFPTLIFDCASVTGVWDTAIGKPIRPIRRRMRRPGRGQCVLFLP